MVKLSLLLALLITISGCSDITQGAQIAFENGEDRRLYSEGIYTTRLGRWTDEVPKDAVLQIDANDDYQVYLVSNNQKQALGRLEYQLPDTPLRTMFLDTGHDKFVLGWIDESVPGNLTSVILSRYIPPTETKPRNQFQIAWGVDVGSRHFFLPMFDDERWQRIDGVSVFTEESRRNTKTTPNTPWAFNKPYEPYLDITPFLKQVTITSR